ncbi:hypothetical protein Tco_0413774 [Tanacetum coccineum]
MNSFPLNPDTTNPLSLVVEVVKQDLDVIDYDSFESDLDDGIDPKRREQLRELRRIGKAKNYCPYKFYFYLGPDSVMGKNVFSQAKCGPVIRENNTSGKQLLLGKGNRVKGKGKKVIEHQKEDKYLCLYTMLFAYTNERIWEVRTLNHEYKYLQSRTLKACTFRFLAYHVLQTLTTNLDIPVRVVQDQMQKQFDVGILRKKAFMLQFRGGAYKEMLWKAATTNTLAEFNKRMDELKSYNHAALVVQHYKINLMTCLEYIKEYLMKRNVEVQQVIAKTIGELIPTLKLIFSAIKSAASLYNVEWNGCIKYQVKEPWLDQCVVDMDTKSRNMGTCVLIQGHQKKRKKSADEIASQSCSTCKLYRKGKSIKCSLYGNLGHNNKGCKVKLVQGMVKSS